MLGQKSKTTEHLYLKKTLSKLRGHAVPIFGFHILREHILAAVTGEYQSSILYWAGRDLAGQLTVTSYEECVDLFSELGWGKLKVIQSQKYQKIFQLESPFFFDRRVAENQSTFALECGFLAEVVAQLEHQKTQGEFSFMHKKEAISIQFTIDVEAQGTISS